MNIVQNTNLHGDAEELEESLLGRPEQLEHFPALTCQLDCLAQCPPEILLPGRNLSGLASELAWREEVPCLHAHCTTEFHIRETMRRN